MCPDFIKPIKYPMRVLVTYLLLLVAGTAFAQINFEPGTITKNDGSTQQCLIKNVAWKNNPVDITYKLTEGEEEKRGTLTDLAGFEVGAYKFIRATVAIERSSTLVGYMDNTAKPNYATETLFLKVLIEGNAILYGYEEGNLKKFFYSSETEKTPKQLFYKRYEQDLKIKEYNQYYSQLTSLFNITGNPQDTFKNVKYNQESLKKLFIQYNGVNGTVTDKTSGQNKSSVNFKVTAGVNFASLSADIETGMFTSGHDFGSQVVPTVGIEAEWILPFNNNKWGLFINPAYQSFKKDDRVVTSSGGSTPDSWYAKATQVSTPIGVHYYMFLNKKSRVFITAAYVLGFKVNGSIKSQYNTYDLANTTNLMAGVGFAYDKFAGELRFHQNSNLINYTSTTTDYKNIGLVLSYKLF